jgi:nitroreductase
MIANDTIHTIKTRRSTRSFTDDQIKEDELQSVLEAGLYAPSAINQQAWHFTVIQNKELLNWLNEHAKETAKTFDNEHIRAMAHNEKLHIFYGAPTVILVSGKEDATSIESDCAAANQNMLLAAESIGLGSCWVNLILFLFQHPDAKKYMQELGIPAGYRPICSVALGYKKVNTVNTPARKPNRINYIR